MKFEEIIRTWSEANQQHLSNDDREAWVLDRLARHNNPGEPFENRMKYGRIVQVIDRKTGDGGTVSAYFDITEIKNREEELEKSQATLQTVLETIDQGITMFDADLNLVAINDYVHLHQGLPRKKFKLGDPFEKFIRYSAEHGEFGDVDVEQLVHDRVELAKKFLPNHFERVRPDGKVMEICGNPVPGGGGFVTTYTDVTKRKQAEKALQDSEARLDAFFTNAPLGLVIWDDQQRYLKVNDVTAKWDDMPAEDHIGKTLAEVFPAFENLRNVKLQQIMETGIPVLNQEYTVALVARPNEELTWQVSYFSIPGASSKSVGVGSIAIDITEQKRAEGKIRNLNAELEHRVEDRTTELHDTQKELVRAERLATLGQLSATVSHELRNPLGTISNSLVLVEEKVRGMKLGVKRDIERIARSVSRCDKIIYELLEYARARDLELEPTRIDPWLIEMLDELTVPPDVTVHRKLQAPNTKVAINSERMRRAVLNIYDNACQAMAEEPNINGGKRKQKMTIHTKVSKGRLELTISDSGLGMPTEVFDHAFEPLYSTKGFGVGLGLPIVRQIMEQHNGGIKIMSRHGDGTQVVLWLPLLANKTQAAQKSD